MFYVSCILLTGILFSGSMCSGPRSGSGYGNGELIGAKSWGNWKETAPYGMVFIRRGTLNIGPNDQDPASSTQPTRTVSIEAFWMDDTEITNIEYRQFINWVRDSIIRRLLGDQYPEYLITEDKNGSRTYGPVCSTFDRRRLV